MCELHSNLKVGIALVQRNSTIDKFTLDSLLGSYSDNVVHLLQLLLDRVNLFAAYMISFNCLAFFLHRWGFPEHPWEE